MRLTPDICQTILEGLPAAVYVVDRMRNIMLWNTGAETITGYLRQEVIQHCCADNLLMHCDENNTALCGVACPLAQTMHDGKPRAANVFLRHKEGHRVPVRVQAVPIRDESGAIIGAAECFEERMVDVATGLSDRPEAVARLEAALEAQADSHVRFGVLNIEVNELDRLRHVNGRLAVGRVLRAVGQTLASALQPGDWIGRWTEDRFVLIVADGASYGLESLAIRLQWLVARTGVPWWGGRISVAVSIGAAMARAGDTPESLVGRAEQLRCGDPPSEGDLIGIA